MTKLEFDNPRYSELIQNMKNTYGEKGRIWLTHLNNTIKILTSNWEINNLSPVNNMSFHFVAKATSHNTPVVLKIGYDEQSIKNEIQSLKYFSGNGCIQLIDFNMQHNALLLHHDNIINNENQWLAIDPKGIVGDAEFEIAWFNFIYKNEIKKLNVKKLFEERASLIAKKANLNLERIKDWVFVRLVLSAAWSIEDNDDPSWAIELAEMIS